ALIVPCILAGSKENDWILDPFLGSGTVGEVSQKMNRKFVGIELNSEYAKIAKRRVQDLVLSF
ncbi:MAG: DNA methyltransferase, partial [Flavobacteriales bacterium]